MNTAVKQDALDQLKPIAYFDPYKGNNASPKQNTDAKPGKAVAPKNMRVKENLQKPELDVTHLRMASSIAKKLKTMSPDELKQTLSALDITPENFHEVAKSSFEILGEDNSAELFKSLLAENGMTSQDVKKALQTPEFLNALGVNADVSPGSGELDSIKTLMHHLTSAFEGNPYLLILTLSDKSDRINYQVQGSALKGMQTVTNSMHETTKGLNENISDTKKQEQENDDKHWWQKALDIVKDVFVAVAVMVIVNVVVNLVVPGLGFALDTAIAFGSTLLEGATDAAEVGAGVAEGLEDATELADFAADSVEEKPEEVGQDDKKTEESKPKSDDSPAELPEDNIVRQAQNANQEEKSLSRLEKARRKLGDAIASINDQIASVKQAAFNKFEGTDTGAKFMERDRAGKNIGKKMTDSILGNKMLSLKSMVKLGLGFGAAYGVYKQTIGASSNQNAKLQLLQAEANIMNEGLQADKLNLDAAQNITSQAQQGIQANGYTGSWAINNMMNLMKI